MNYATHISNYCWASFRVVNNPGSTNLSAMPVVLMVAEKPSLAKSLAEILSRRNFHTRKSACGACPVHEYEGSFPPGSSRRVKFKMTSVCGHVMSLDFQPRYNNWEKTDPVCSHLRILSP